jgi:hypothetical protein
MVLSDATSCSFVDADDSVSAEASAGNISSEIF